MIRPAAFGFNPETAVSNSFQKMDSETPSDILKRAQIEFDTMVELLVAHDINVHVIEDTAVPKKPDAIFPNNWISFQPDGVIILYPMHAVNRRSERRADVVEWAQSRFLVKDVVDESPMEAQQRFLEGTGSLIFDHVNKIAYACRSPRTDEALTKDLCGRLGYEPVVFDAVDEKGIPIYHTNVMMCVGTKFAIICLDSIKSEADQDLVLDRFVKTGHKVVAISYSQMESFAGNMIEVEDRDGQLNVLLSQTAFDSLLPGQIDAITKSAELIPISIPTIERYGGGSVRCMVAGIHLNPKS
jgi:hypothetical protein